MAWRVAIVALAVALACAGRASGEDLAEYLERRELTGLLAVHLEEQIRTTSDASTRERLAMRLAEVYAELLEDADDVATMEDLERRGRRLLAQVPPAGAAELRLAVLRASYRSAALSAELHRLRRAEAEDVERARVTFDRIVPELATLRADTEDQVDLLERRVSRAAGVEAALLADEVERQRRLKAQATFLEAWGRYYQAWLSGEPRRARDADPLFVELLETGLPAPRPGDVSEDLRALESFARSILGLALVRGYAHSPRAGLEWLELLDTAGAFAALRQELPAWRLAIRLDGEDYPGAVEVLDGLAGREPRAPTAWFRLAAARALESLALEASGSAGGGPGVRELADLAVAELAARGELAEVLTLARRYGAERLGGDGFVLRYVRGVERYEAARAGHGGDGAAPTAGQRQAFLDAARELAAALQEPDAAVFGGAAAGCRALVGWCLYFAGAFADAAEAFEVAAESQLPDDAAESMWMAIVSLESAQQAATGAERAELRSRLATIGDAFLQRFPSSEHAPRLMLRRILDRREPSLDAVEELKAIPAGSDVFADAQRQAAQMLYLLFRGETEPEARQDLARRFMAAAMPLFEDDVSWLMTSVVAEQGDQVRRDAMVIRGRQVLEVALSRGVDRPGLAREVLDAFEELAERQVLELDRFRDELDHRRMQRALAVGDAAGADALATALLERSGDSVWGRSAARILYRTAVEEWSGGAPGAPEEGQRLARVIRYGDAVLGSTDDAEIASDRGLAACLSTVARARTRAWEIGGDPAMAESAMALTERVLALRPDDEIALRNGAVLAEGLGRKDLALERLRRVLLVSAQGSEPWFEAKWRVLMLLADLDPVRAREVLDQHVALNPDYGPEPWRTRFLDLDGRLPPAPNRGDSPDAEDLR